jgi:hypothetical protein
MAHRPLRAPASPRSTAPQGVSQPPDPSFPLPGASERPPRLPERTWRAGERTRAPRSPRNPSVPLPPKTRLPSGPLSVTSRQLAATSCGAQPATTPCTATISTLKIVRARPQDRLHPRPPKQKMNPTQPQDNIEATARQPGAPARSISQPQPGASASPTPRRRPTASTPYGPEAARGVRGVVPPEEHCEPPARGLKAPEHRATPGGYGGKPPGVAIIGVPTGARNAGSDAPTGDQSIDMNRTRKHPLVCQDPITTRSRDEPEQAQSVA